MSKRHHRPGRCHSAEPRLAAYFYRSVALELLPELRRQAGDPAEGKVERNRDALLFAEGGDVELLTLEIDRVARIDGELPGDLRIERANLRPDAGERGKLDVGIGEQLVG